MVPIGSVMSQEVWLWLSEAKRRPNPGGQIEDLALSDAASRGSWGSFRLLFQAKRRYSSLIGQDRHGS